MSFVMPTPEQVELVDEWVLRRRVTNYALFPPDVKEKLQPAIDELIELGIQNADITGSFARGDYCLTREDVNFKIQARLGAKMSDIDFLIYDKEFIHPKLSDCFDTERFKCLWDSYTIPIIRDGKVV